VETCAYGDKDDELCEPSMDCSISVLRELCCSTCANYVVPEVVEGAVPLRLVLILCLHVVITLICYCEYHIDIILLAHSQYHIDISLAQYQHHIDCYIRLL